MDFPKKIKQYIEEVDPQKVISISDLELKEYDGLALENEEKEALEKFYRVRIEKLEKRQQKEESFHRKFEYFRAISNLVDYRDILSDKLPI